MARRTTQQEVAELAGVTRATVSYVLGGRSGELGITDAVVRRVRRAARELRYTPSHAARALASGKSMTLGLLLAEAGASATPFWALIAEGVEAAALGAGYDVLLIDAPGDVGGRGARYLRQGRVDALVVLGRVTASGARQWAKVPVPPVVIHAFGPPGLPSVGLDPEPGLRQAAGHLAERGHRRLLWLSPGRRLDYGRSAVAQGIAEKCGLQADVLDLGVARRPIGKPLDEQIAFWRDAIRRRLPHRPAATAVLCWNDRMALGLYAVLAERGWRVGEDLSVVGFDDLEAPLALPAMSSISHEFRKMGTEATGLALGLADGSLSREADGDIVVRVPSRFVSRRSTGPAGDLSGERGGER